MKYIFYILTIIIGIITSFIIWIYIQRVNLDYNSEGIFFSSENGTICHKQAKGVYGIFALLGLFFTRFFILKIYKKTKID